MPDRPDLLIVNPFHPETVAKLDSLYTTHHLWRCDGKDKLDLIQNLQGKCEAAATGSWACDELVYTLSSLRIIAAFGVGIDGIDLHETNKLAVKITNTPGVLDDAVADIAMALVLATTRKIVNADKFTRGGSWQTTSFPAGTGLAGKILGIVGLGRIGESIVHRALPFKLKIAYHNRSPKNLPYSYFPTIAELAANSDILLCMLPGGDDTRKIINEHVFQSLGPDGIFINVGRGSCVDEEALVSALQSGQIAGAGLDVYAREPSIPESLITMENTVLLPHIGSATEETQREMGNLLIKNLDAFFSGKPLISEVA